MDGFGSAGSPEDVGFYYAANAAGRLLGIIPSGQLYQFAGIEGCLIGSAVMLLAGCAITFVLPNRSGFNNRRSEGQDRSGPRAAHRTCYAPTLDVRRCRSGTATIAKPTSIKAMPPTRSGPNCSPKTIVEVIAPTHGDNKAKGATAPVE